MPSSLVWSFTAAAIALATARPELGQIQTSTVCLRSCQCVLELPDRSLEARVSAAVASSGMVFLGTAGERKSIHDGPVGLGLEVSFAVSRTWKGGRGDSVRVRTGISDSECGYEFRLGYEYLVYARRIPPGNDDYGGLLVTGICSRTSEATSAQARDDLAILSESR